MLPPLATALRLLIPGAAGGKKISLKIWGSCFYWPLALPLTFSYILELLSKPNKTTCTFISEQDCEHEGLRYLHYEQKIVYSGNCTSVKESIERNTNTLRNARRECLSHMGGQYQGDISYGSVRRVPIATLQVCMEGESHVEYKEEACCPGTCFF